MTPHPRINHEGQKPVKRVVFVAIAMGALAAACGSGSSGGPPTTSGTASDGSSPSTARAFPTIAAKQAAEPALLTRAAFPSSWTTSPSDSSNGGLSDHAIDRGLAACLHAPVRLFAESGADQVEADSPDFNAPKGSNESVSESVDVGTTAYIDESLKVFHEPGLPRCVDHVVGPVLRTVLGKKAAREGVTIGQSTTHVLDLPSIGQDTAGFDLSVPITAPGISTAEILDVVIVRHDNSGIEMDFSNLGSPFNASLADSLTRKAYTKLLTVRVPKA
jgi:hypothetical protein